MAVVLRPECCDLAKTYGTAGIDAFSLQFLEERTGIFACSGHRHADRAEGFNWFNAQAGSGNEDGAGLAPRDERDLEAIAAEFAGNAQATAWTGSYDRRCYWS